MWCRLSRRRHHNSCQGDCDSHPNYIKNWTSLQAALKAESNFVAGGSVLKLEVQVLKRMQVDDNDDDNAQTSWRQLFRVESLLHNSSVRAKRRDTATWWAFLIWVVSHSQFLCHDTVWLKFVASLQAVQQNVLRQYSNSTWHVSFDSSILHLCFKCFTDKFSMVSSSYMKQAISIGRGLKLKLPMKT